ncbi:MAG TPA: thioredoxin domain-containing protein [Mucilaginibacter sp.]|nr:thioredoxin domain-containing protein [Mucilaginibacter sp.]
MKKLVLFVCFLAAVACTNAQTQPQAFVPPAYIPEYKILTTDSTYVTPANLKKNVPTMIIYFAPDCSHCQHLMFELKPHMKELKNMQVVMITFVKEIKAIQVFARDFDLNKYPNWTVGTEGYTYKVQQFYRVATTPYIAIYNKIGKPVKYIDKSPKVEDILAATKKL